MNWTESQREAIEERGCNLLVSAAAGSGKTAVLVERITRLVVEEGVDLDRLLVVTFTNAAAAEMKERISRRIAAELETRSGLEEHLLKQMQLLGRASISTLHSFCTEVVRRHFHLVGVDPNFRIGDESQTLLIQQEVIEELLEKEYEQADPTFTRLVEMFASNRNDSPLVDLLLRIYSFILSNPMPFHWLREKVQAFDLDSHSFAETPWIKFILDRSSQQLNSAREVFQEALELCGLSGGPVEYREALQEDLAIVDQLQAALQEGLEPFCQQVQQVQHPRLKRAGKSVDETLKDKVKDLREEGKQLVQSIGSDYLKKAPQELLEDLQELHPVLEYLAGLVREFHREYRQKKQDQGLLDFNDLEHLALDILEEEAVAREYRNKYLYIFVDEYQDSNPVQEAIINRVKREDNLFLVGDVKQSIYRFRLADPSLFLDKHRTYQDTRGEPGRRIDLSDNFRSCSEILECVNFFFSWVMSPELGEITYDDKASLFPALQSAPDGKVSVEMHILEKIASTLDEDELDGVFNDMEIEARMVGRRILDLVGQSIWDARSQSFRTVDYRDIVILLRSTRNWAPVFQDTLQAMGIPVYTDSNTGYFDALEVNIFLNLLRLVDNKQQDIPLISVMRSSIGGFSLEDLLEIRLYQPGKPFYLALEAYSREKDDQISAAAREFIERLEQWQEQSRWLPVDQFIWKLMVETGYYDYTGALPGGFQRQANLRLLLDRARQFEATTLKGLFSFLRYLDRVRTSSGDMGVARILGENDNVVRIMSVHKSKGLEFPVVIVAGLGKQFNLTDITAPVLLHRELGIGPRYINPDLRIYSDTIARVALREAIRLENLSEEMRILYVALTRAENALLLFGSISNLEGHCRAWNKSLTPFNLARARCYLDWLGAVLIRHPDGEELRKYGLLPEEIGVTPDSSRWQVQVYQREKILQLFGNAELKREALSELTQPDRQLPSPAAAEIQRRLDWEYPYRQAVNIPSKLSATQIARRAEKGLFSLGMELPALVTRPGFMEELRPLSGAEKGTILHFVMQQLDFKRVGSPSEIGEQLGEMVRKELLTAEEYDTVEVAKIYHFFQSPLGQRILQAKRVEREVAFNQTWKVSELFPTVAGEDERLLVQGVIDLFFVEGKEVVLVDYKSDFISRDPVDPHHSREVVVKRYRHQIELYKRALESILGQPVKESYLYLFYTGEAVPINSAL